MELIKVEFEVSGQPQGKGRPRFTRNGYAYTPEKTREYEKRIHASAWHKMRELKLDTIEKFCHVEIIAFMEIPKSWTKVKRLEAEYGAILPTSKPDLDNIIKAALDGAEGVIYFSDTQVTSINAKKVYCHPDRGPVLYMSVSWTV
mgnify:FL=1|tara:strand:+ start:1260 stop:1694 length:435 start_codon:yes stop_codon:yes gene_type:complete